jgi:hypothetical protein
MRPAGATFFDSTMEVHAIMKYGISFLLGPGLAGALLLGSACVVVPEGTPGDDDPADVGPAEAPRLTLDIRMPTGVLCTVAADSQDRTCEGPIASNSQAVVDVSVDWDDLEPDLIELEDDCGGTLQFVFNDLASYRATWVSPAEQDTCVITARATSKNGVRSDLSVAVVVQGQRPQLGYPLLSAKLTHSNGTCILPAGQFNVTCSAPVRAGDVMQASLQIDWGNQTQSQISVSPTCGGEFVDPVDDGSTFASAWLAPLIDDDDCSVMFEAISQDGAITTAKMNFSVVDGQPPGEVYAYLYLEHTGGQCYLYPGAFATDCAPVTAGERALFYVEIDWGNYEAGSITVSDTCDGNLATTFSSSTNKQFDWDVSAVAAACTVQVEAITADGALHTFEMNVPVN